MFGEVEFDFWRKGENVREARKANLDLFKEVAIPFGEKATYLKPDGEVVPGIPHGERLRALTGHARIPCREQ